MRYFFTNSNNKSVNEKVNNNSLKKLKPHFNYLLIKIKIDLKNKRPENLTVVELF